MYFVKYLQSGCFKAGSHHVRPDINLSTQARSGPKKGCLSYPLKLTHAIEDTIGVSTNKYFAHYESNSIYSSSNLKSAPLIIMNRHNFAKKPIPTPSPIFRIRII